MEKEEEKIIDQNTEPAVDDNVEVLNPEEETLAQTDEVIPAPEGDGTFPMGTVEPVNPEIPVDTIPATETIPLTVDETPVEEPVEEPETPPQMPVPEQEPVDIPAEEPVDEPAPVISDVVPEVGDENPTDVPVDAPVEPAAEECPNCEGESPTDIAVPGECPNCEGEGCPTCDSAVRVPDVFGTLQEAVTIIWRYHLKTKKYSNHIALHEFYEKALDLVDDIIERYQGINGIIEDQYTNCVCPGECEVEYLNSLRDFINANRFVVGDHSELQSSFDDILGLIDTTLYKINNLTESNVKSFEEFVYEDYCCDNDDEDTDEEKDPEEE